MNDAQPPYSPSEIQHAVEVLFDSYLDSGGGFSADCERFEPYRPYAAPCVPYLVEKLDAEREVERDAAAWVLGVMADAATSAVPDLLQRLKQDPNSNMLAWALERIPLDQAAYETLCDLAEQSPNQFFDCMRILGDNISTERLQRWVSHPEGQFRSRAIDMLHKRNPGGIKEILLDALRDANHNVVDSAQRILAKPESETAAWFFTELPTLNKAAQEKIAEALCHHRTDLSAYRDEVFNVLRNSNDERLVEYLAAAVAFFSDKQAGDVDVLASIRTRFDSVGLKMSLILTIRRQASHGVDRKLIDTLAGFLEEPDAWVRCLAVEKIGSFLDHDDLVMPLLQRALNDRSERVQLKAVWMLQYRRSQALPVLLELFESRTASGTLTDRMAAELAWAMSMLPDSERILEAIPDYDVAERPMSASARLWLAARRS